MDIYKLTKTRRVFNDLQYDIISICINQLKSREVLVELCHQPPQLSIELQGQIIVFLNTIMVLQNVCCSLQWQTPHRRQPSQRNFPCPKAINFLEEALSKPYEEVLILLNNREFTPSFRECVVVLKEVIGPYADQIQSLSYYFIGLLITKMCPQFLLVLLVILNFFP